MTGNNKSLKKPAASLEDRFHKILCVIVQSYIETTEPVGSRSLSKKLDLGISPATIRNIMADLTEQGFLEQPHTSAGRVPTYKGYRYFVDICMGQTPLSTEVKRVIEQAVRESSQGLVSRLTSTCQLLAGLTQFTGIVASPRISQTRLRKVEFLKIEERRIYVVLITQSNMVLHKIIEVSETLSQDFLNSVSASLNRQFETEPLDDVREQVLQSLSESHEKYNQLLAQAVRLSRKAFDLTEERQLYVDGQSFIVKEFNDIEKIQRLLETLEEKITLIGLMDNGMDEEGVQVTIGEENPITDLQTCSLITANYSNGGIVLGSIGILGPTRMDYSRVIPIIDYTAKALSEAIANQ